MNLKKTRSDGLQKLIAVNHSSRSLLRDLLLTMGLKSAHRITCVYSTKNLSRGRAGSDDICIRGGEGCEVIFYISLNSPFLRSAIAWIIFWLCLTII